MGRHGVDLIMGKNYSKVFIDEIYEISSLHVMFCSNQVTCEKLLGTITKQNSESNHSKFIFKEKDFISLGRCP